MNNGVCAVTLAGLLLTTTAACSSGPDQGPPAPGALTPGTAAITINDRDLGTITSVGCTSAGPLTTITTGNENSGSTAVVSNADGLSAQSVYIRDLGGFTGSYNSDLDGTAEVTMTGNTFVITGSADGFDTERPSFRTAGSFEIKVAC
ncbi:lipoprotein LpqH [Mycolicibacterium mengxianglii]|uniref:lipoprotein LpqH n=1 Tax=Mycolicibacterium mengxianglii TaxID=2736649 RepID=UPI0018EF1B8E|nr:lipoprotein LpqH [Mycolicibacterium mengxianglii]